jgi:hypothetical protein
MPQGHVREQICITQAQLTGLAREMMGLRGETFAVTLRVFVKKALNATGY